MEEMVRIKKAVKLLNHRKVNGIIEKLRYAKKPMRVTDLYVELRMEQSEVSQVLADMRELGWVEYRRDGKWHLYSIVQDALMDIMLLVERVHQNLYPERDSPNKQVFNLYRALGHGVRMKMMRYIQERGSVTVQPIYQDLEMEQSMVSQHLRILREAGLVRGEKDGKFVEYFVNDAILVMVERLSEEWLEVHRVEERVALAA